MNILFVSEKDECRGPIAKALGRMHARNMNVPNAGFDSAGVDSSTASLPPPEVVQFLRDQGYNLSKHYSSPITAAKVRWADLILCMTHRLAERTIEIVGPHCAGSVVVLNTAVRSGRTREERDIEVEAYNQRCLLTVLARLKVSTGRLVRNLSNGEDDPADFGVQGGGNGSEPHYLDDPHLRTFLSRYIFEFIERAFEPPHATEILEAITAMGRPLSLLDLRELLTVDLRGCVSTDASNGTWHIAEEELERRRTEQRQRRAEQQRRDAENEEARDDREKAEPRRERAKPAPDPSTGDLLGDDEDDSGRISEAQALDILAVSLQTQRVEAAKKYKQLLMRFHPDKFHDDDQFRAMAERKTKRINLAWSVVKNLLPDDDDD